VDSGVLKKAQVQLYLPGGANVPSHVGALAPPGKYDWIVHLQRRCGLIWPLVIYCNHIVKRLMTLRIWKILICPNRTHRSNKCQRTHPQPETIIHWPHPFLNFHHTPDGRGIACSLCASSLDFNTCGKLWWNKFWNLQHNFVSWLVGWDLMAFLRQIRSCSIFKVIIWYRYLQTCHYL